MKPGAATTARPIDGPVRELLEWIAARPRTYAEAAAAWRSTCPRITPWEDAQIEGLVEVDGSRPDTPVRLTAAGRAVAARP